MIVSRRIDLRRCISNNLPRWSQSNSMLALAALANHLSLPFYYYCKKVPRWLRSNPSGNYHRATSLNMTAWEIPHKEYSEAFDEVMPAVNPPLAAPIPGSLWVPCGGAHPLAER